MFLIENRTTDTSHFETFTDDFLEKKLFGWTRYGNAITEYSNSELRIQTGNYQEFYNCIEIPLNSFAMKTVVQYNQGDSSSFYGFFVKKMAESDTLFYHFAISADKRFVIRSRGSDAEPASVQTLISASKSQYDTLELTRDNGVLVFSINGVKLGECSEISGIINGAGLFVSSRLNIFFDEFQIMSLGMQTSNKKIIKKGSDVRLAGKKHLSIDLLGRCFSVKETTFPSKWFLEMNNKGEWEKRIRMRQ
jgi:hypothetical protein